MVVGVAALALITRLGTGGDSGGHHLSLPVVTRWHGYPGCPGEKW
jgi:hypothetical protein